MILLPAGNASEWTGPDGNNTYLLPGRVPALVDAGVGRPAHLDAVARALGGAALATVLVTHSHPDHASGVPALVERWPSVRVRSAVADPIRNGDRIPAGDGDLVAVHTPGHAPDHFCFFDATTRDLYCGDLVRLGGTIVIPASGGGDVQEYLESLERVRALQAARLLPGHGPIIEHPSAVIETFIAHRQLRERQILDALRAGDTTPDAIVRRVYGTLSPRLASAAADTVRAHMIKLQREGRWDEPAGL